MFRNLGAALTAGALLIFGAGAGAIELPKVDDLMNNDALVSGLTGSLGLDAEQAQGGLGSILSLAKNKLPAADYESLVGVLPGADKYVKAAKDAGLLTDPITDLGKLNAAMEKLGIGQETASKLYSQLGNFVGAAGGDSLKSKLMGLLT